jgi:hypothetical protein
MKLVRLLIFLALAVLPVAAACGSEGGDNERVAGIVSRMLALGQPAGASVQHFAGRLPDDMPVELPSYPGSTLMASLRYVLGEDAVYFIVLDTVDSPDDVLQYYEGVFSEDPWQVEATSSTEELTALQFSKVDDANMSGAVAVNQSLDGDARSSIFMSLEVLSGAGEEEGEPFQLGASRPLPRDFPSDIPIYEGSTVIATAYVRSSGNQDFLVTFLSQDSQDEVIDYYRKEFEGRGWSVADQSSEEFAVSISFQDSTSPEVSGTVSADVSPEEEDYTQVQMQLRVASGREAGE